MRKKKEKIFLKNHQGGVTGFEEHKRGPLGPSPYGTIKRGFAGCRYWPFFMVGLRDQTFFSVGLRDDLPAGCNIYDIFCQYYGI